jgi:hypothetical protein
MEISPQSVQQNVWRSMPCKNPQMKQRRGEILCLYNARSWVKLKEEEDCVWKKDGYLISAACYC